MAKSKVDEKDKEQIRQEKVEETVSKTDEFFRRNKKLFMALSSRSWS